MSTATRARLLWAAATDRTFTRAQGPMGPCLVGKCIHCGTKLALALDGTPISRATVEHIVPRTHGGTDDVDNLAVACARCNHGKGHRLDHRPWTDPTLQRVMATLRARRIRRLRTPPPDLALPPRPGAPVSSRGDP